MRDGNALACAFTGHRPGRYRFGYDEEDETCIQLKAALAEQIAILIGAGITTFYSGMALGADQWAASIVLSMRVSHPKVRLIAVLSCETQANKWSVEHRERYFNTLAECDDVITLNTHHTSTCVFERSRYLVDHADYLVAVYDNGLRGSTACMIRYAQEKRRQIISIHPDTLEIATDVDLEALKRRAQIRVVRDGENTGGNI